MLVTCDCDWRALVERRRASFRIEPGPSWSEKVSPGGAAVAPRGALPVTAAKPALARYGAKPTPGGVERVTGPEPTSGPF